MEEKSRFRVRVGTYKLFYIVYNARVSRSASFALCLRNKVSAKLARVLYNTVYSKCVGRLQNETTDSVQICKTTFLQEL